MLPLVPGVAATAVGVLIATLSRRPSGFVVGAASLGFGLVATVCLEPAFFGWAFMSGCLFVTSRSLRFSRELAQN